MGQYWVALLVTCALAVGTAVSARAEGIDVSVDWDKSVRVSNTTATLQVVVNPLIRRGSPIHERVFRELKSLGADQVRFVPWMPYPKLAVAELEPPSETEAFWDFSLIDPMVEDFFEATAGHSVMLNFSTIPQWMFKTDWHVGYPADPNEAYWAYEQGTELRDPTHKELGDYYARVISWYTRGGFVDELGRFRQSGHRFKIGTWEILNEPDAEHLMSVQQYTERYDAIAASIREVAPEMRFMGLSLMRPMFLTSYFEYFLNSSNHRPGTPLDWISYHFYATTKRGESIESQVRNLFSQADEFLKASEEIRAIRDRLSPDTRIAINELGTMRAEDLSNFKDLRSYSDAIPSRYWNLSAAVYAYAFGELAKSGTDLVGESQLVGFPGQFPSVSMVDWEDGLPNARYWVLKLLLDHYAPGDAIMESASTDSARVYALALVKPNGTRKLLLVNRSDSPQTVRIPAGINGWFEAVTPSADKPVFGKIPTSRSLDLEGLSVSIVTL